MTENASRRCPIPDSFFAGSSSWGDYIVWVLCNYRANLRGLVDSSGMLSMQEAFQPEAMILVKQPFRERHEWDRWKQSWIPPFSICWHIGTLRNDLADLAIVLICDMWFILFSTQTLVTSHMFCDSGPSAMQMPGWWMPASGVQGRPFGMLARSITSAPASNEYWTHRKDRRAKIHISYVSILNAIGYIINIFSFIIVKLQQKSFRHFLLSA